MFMAEALNNDPNSFIRIIYIMSNRALNRIRRLLEFPCSPDDLVGAVSFGDIETVAAEIGVSAQQLAYWRRGREPVPKAVFLWLNHRSDTTLGK